MLPASNILYGHHSDEITRRSEAVSVRPFAPWFSSVRQIQSADTLYHQQASSIFHALPPIHSFIFRLCWYIASSARLNTSWKQLSIAHDTLPCKKTLHLHKASSTSRLIFRYLHIFGIILFMSIVFQNANDVNAHGSRWRLLFPVHLQRKQLYGLSCAKLAWSCAERESGV